MENIGKNIDIQKSKENNFSEITETISTKDIEKHISDSISWILIFWTNKWKILIKKIIQN